MSPNDNLELLIFNTERVQVWHFSVLQYVEENVDNHDAVAEGTWTREQGVVFLLSDALKEKYEMMIDDIEVRHIAGHPPYMKEFRQDLIRELAHAALAVVDWNALARAVIARRSEN